MTDHLPDTQRDPSLNRGSKISAFVGADHASRPQARRLIARKPVWAKTRGDIDQRI
jgi:hypothetical protein